MHTYRCDISFLFECKLSVVDNHITVHGNLQEMWKISEYATGMKSTRNSIMESILFWVLMTPYSTNEETHLLLFQNAKNVHLLSQRNALQTKK